MTGVALERGEPTPGKSENRTSQVLELQMDDFRVGIKWK